MPTQRSQLMTGVALLAAAGAMQGCGCSEKNLRGDADSDTDTDAPDGMGDTDGDITSDVACPTCDDGDPCTVDTCETGTMTCTNEPYDGDGDGYPGMLAPDGTTVCPGTDCDDDDPLTHPGAEEICMDGIDEDCDTIVDGPKAMLSTVHLKTLAEGISPALAWTGSEFAVAWAEMGGVYFGRVDLEGEVVGETGAIVTAVSAFYPSIAWTGSELGIVYDSWPSWPCHTGDVDCFSNVELVRVSPSGDVVGVPLRLDDPDTITGGPDIVWSGSEYGVFWVDGRDGPCPSWGNCEQEYYFTRVQPDGVEIGVEQRLTDEDERVGTTPGADPLWNGSGFALPWLSIAGDSFTDFALTRVAADGALAGTTSLDHLPRGMAWSGSTYGIVWQDEASGDSDIFLEMLDGSGARMGSPIQLTVGDGHQAYPSVAWTGSAFGVAWMDGREDDDCATMPWEWAGECHPQIHFSVVGGDGAVIWDQIRITARDTCKYYERLVWTGSEFGIAWFEIETSSPLDHEFSLSFDRISFCE